MIDSVVDEAASEASSPSGEALPPCDLHRASCPACDTVGRQLLHFVETCGTYDVLRALSTANAALMRTHGLLWRPAVSAVDDRCSRCTKPFVDLDDPIGVCPACFIDLCRVRAYDLTVIAADYHQALRRLSSRPAWYSQCPHNVQWAACWTCRQEGDAPRGTENGSGDPGEGSGAVVPVDTVRALEEL